MNKRILFVDDEQCVLDALCRMLRGQRSVWDMVCVNDPYHAWEQLQDGSFDVVVSDLSMPGMTGLELLDRVRHSPLLHELPVIVLTGMETRSLKRQALDMGAADLLNKPVDPEDLVARLCSVLRLKASQDELKAQNSVLEDKVQQRTADLNRSRLDAIWRLAKAAEHRDDDTGNHVIRVGCISRIIAETLGLDREFVETLFVTAPLHDIGKIGIPDSILLKSGPLSKVEWDVMKQHCSIGARILQEDTKAAHAFEEGVGRHDGLAGCQADNPILRTAANIALMHHEKWDGSGYPQELAGEQIALEARIVAVADVFDAIVSRRPYKAPCSEAVALEMMHDTVHSHFDPLVYAAFEQSLPAIRSVRARFTDEVEQTPIFDEAGNETDLVCR
ncbi:MAG: HD domain-containing phosphohydrolase [Pirellulaceae bacterium]